MAYKNGKFRTKGKDKNNKTLIFVNRPHGPSFSSSVGSSGCGEYGTVSSVSFVETEV